MECFKFTAPDSWNCRCTAPGSWNEPRALETAENNKAIVQGASSGVRADSGGQQQ
jgi:hypothetical protein